MYAIVQDRGRQYRVEAGDTLRVDTLEVEPGGTIEFDHVLLIGGGNGVQVGSPTVAGALVRAEVLGEEKGEKIVIFKYRNKKRFRRRTGHRQKYTRITITEIISAS